MMLRDPRVAGGAISKTINGYFRRVTWRPAMERLRSMAIPPYQANAAMFKSAKPTYERPSNMSNPVFTTPTMPTM